MVSGHELHAWKGVARQLFPADWATCMVNSHVGGPLACSAKMVLDG